MSASRLAIAAQSALLQPRRFLSALTCTIAVVASAELVQALAPRAAAPLLATVYGGVTAFNLLLFFPPGTLTRPPRRIMAALALNLVPMPLAPLLYGISPVLADAAFILGAGVAVLVRPLGPPVNGMALLATLNLLIPLVMGGAPVLVPLGVLAAVIGTVCATAADAISALLLRVGTQDLERWVLRRELAGFLTDLERLWRAGQIAPDARLTARIALIRRLREEIAPATGGDTPTLPADAMLEAVLRSTVELRKQIGALAGPVPDVVARSLAALAEAARTANPKGAADAIEAMRQASLRRPEAAQPGAAARVLGLALLLSDLIAAAVPRPDKTPEPA